MLGDLLYSLLPYQIFKSVFFRAGMTYLTCYLLVNWMMPKVIYKFRREGITSDFKAHEPKPGPYKGATPIMGGVVLLPAIFISTFLWIWINEYVIALWVLMLSFGLIGGLDDFAKVRQKKRIEQGLEQKKSYADKADGISGPIRLIFELTITLVTVAILFQIVPEVDGHFHIPGIPQKWLYPNLPYTLFIPFATLIIVGGANAVNFTDGLDTLVSIPIITSCIFAGLAAFIAGDLLWSERLKIAFISEDIKEVSIFAIAMIAAVIGFLKFNSPPARIYMGDLGSLGLGAAVCAIFVFVKAELYLPIIGLAFLWAALSSIFQRAYFKWANWRYGRDYALKNRLFYRAPFHHHQQALIHYKAEPQQIRSAWHEWMLKLGIREIPDEDKYDTPEQVNNKVIWNNHLRSIMLLIITMIIYFKVR